MEVWVADYLIAASFTGGKFTIQDMPPIHKLLQNQRPGL